MFSAAWISTEGMTDPMREMQDPQVKWNNQDQAQRRMITG